MIETAPRILNQELFKKRVEDILHTGRFTAGTYKEQLEEKFCKDYGCKHARAISSESRAFKLPLLFLAQKFPTGKVILPTLGNIQAAAACGEVGLNFIPCDVGDDFCIDFDSFERRLDSSVIAAIPSNLFGNLVDYNLLSKYNGLFTIFDSSAGLGICDEFAIPPKYVGSFGDCEIIDFNFNKMCGAFGGSILTTNNDELAEFATSDLDEIRCAAILSQLEQIEDIQSHYFNIYNQYKALLPDWVQLCKPNVYFSSMPIVCKVHPAVRDDLILNLESNGIWANMFAPIHKKSPYFQNLVLSNSERLAAKVFTLPTGLTIDEKAISKIITTIRSFVQ